MPTDPADKAFAVPTGEPADVPLAVLFDRAESNTIEWQGRTVQSFVRFPVMDGDRLLVSRLTASRQRPQALKLAVDAGDLEVNGVRSPSFCLWSTSSPRDTTVVVHGPGAAALDVWNGWRYGDVELDWMGNAGIVLQDANGGSTLQCSDGPGDVDFTALVVTLSLLHDTPEQT